MSFRTRLALVAAAAVGIAVVVASVVVYIVVHDQLYGQVDRALRDRAISVATQPGGPHLNGSGYLDIPPAPFGTERDFVQAVPLHGPVIIQEGYNRSLPVSGRDREAALGGGDLRYSNKHVGDVEWRVLTIPAKPYALQVARPLTEVNRTLHRITFFLILIALGGMGVAAALGLLVSRAALRPVRRLTETTEAITETRDLSQRIETTGGSHDELGRLATSFNTMLGALEESSRAQRQLVADASHELRTPLTSLRTNIEVLARADKLPAGERERLLEDVVEQIGEMTALITELIELAREARPDAVAEPAKDVRLDLLAADAVERARRNRPSVEFTTDLHETFVRGAPSTIERAVANLLDNAAKWSPPGGPVEVAVRDGELAVRDHGPGIEDEDLPYVFDRFYRARTARGMPGSGLGLAIVKQVAEANGGSVAVERAEGGGTLMRLRLNGVPANGDGSGS
jgi:two-component system sensor histidine kinase MprB